MSRHRMEPTLSGSDMSGGGRALSIGPQRSQIEAPIVYQSSSDLLARREAFRRDLAEIARYLRRFAVTKRERYVCDGVSQGESLSIDGLEIMHELMARTPVDYNRFAAFSDRHVQERRAVAPPLCVYEASELEQESNARLDLSQLVAAKEKTTVRWEQVISDARQQYHRTAQLIVSAIRHVRRAS